MHYYEVIPASKRFHGKEPLTYYYDEIIRPGQIVQVKLRNLCCFGVVIKKTAKPDFETVSVEGVLKGLILPARYIELMEWMVSFYPAPLGVIAQLFIPGFLDKIEPLSAKDTVVEHEFEKLPPLTPEQSAAYKAISAEPGRAESFIVHGVTGSGKTRLYAELARDSLDTKKSVLILTPEISLTAPIAETFRKIFGDSVEINHSSLTSKQRARIWERLLYGNKPLIVIGPRSSLFLPLNDIGLIVVDEFHEPAYKQESQPYYHANRTASMLSKLSAAKLVFGSATPPIIDYYLAEQKNVPVIRMDRSAITGNKPLARYLVVDMLKPEEKSGYPLLSKSLISSITDTLNKGEQAMLFINKRGSARSVTCQDCGYRALCKNCDLPLIYHSDQHLMRCHTCGYRQKTPATCPDCGSIKIYFASPGTKAIADNLGKLFPRARIARYDKDNKKAERLENTYQKAVDEIDIIVGTQIIAKGHDLPRLSLVATLLAENNLDFPDYGSEERSYQLLKQLSGRINRGHRKGVFIIQTFRPDSEVISSAIKGSWNDFYSSQIKTRRQHGFPPFYSALKIEVQRKTRKSAEDALSELIKKIASDNKDLKILGPSPSFVEKKASKWHWQAIIMSKSRKQLADISRVIPGTFRTDIDPNNFL